MTPCRRLVRIRPAGWCVTKCGRIRSGRCDRVGVGVGLERLVEKAQQGDSEALAALCVREWPAVYRVITATGAGRDEAEELTQEVFVRVLGRLDGYRSEEGSFRAYLLTAARNLLRDRWRAASRVPVPVSDLTELPGGDPGPEAQALAGAERTALIDALAQLPADYQQVLRWRLLDRLSSAEVAGRLNRSPEAVRQLQRRALVALRWQLGRRVERTSNGA